MEHRVANGDPLRLQLFGSPNRDRVVGGVGRQHVERLPGGDSDPAPLADREVMVAAMTGQRPPAGVDQLALAIGELAVAAQERPLP